MKKVGVAFVLILGVHLGIAQSFIDEPGCPPMVWCNSPIITNDILEDVVDIVGGNMNDTAADSGCDGSWNPSCIFADWFPCGYPEDSAQGSLCGEGNKEKPDPDKPDQENPPANDPPAEENPPSNDDVTTEVLKLPSSGFTAERLFKYYDKTKRGAILHKYPNGFTLRLASKFRNKKSKRLDYFIVFNIVDNKNKTLASPIIMVVPSKNKKGHILLKSDKTLLN